MSRADTDAATPAAVEHPLHPGPGVAVLLCRCGTAIDQDQMRRATPARDTAATSTRIDPIVCPWCAP